MGGVYLTVLYLQRLEKLRTRENWGVCTFCSTKKNPFSKKGILADFLSFDQSEKNAHSYSCFVPLANRKKDLGMHVAFAIFSKENKAKNRNLD